jgi:hypothetical protein
VILPGGPLRADVATRPVDFRKGMDGLAALACNDRVPMATRGDRHPPKQDLDQDV